MTGVAQTERGVVSGMLSLARNLGLMLGASMMGAIFAAAGFRVTFVVGGGVVAISMVIALAKNHRDTEAERLVLV